jgi:hypothetical protein
VKILAIDPGNIKSAYVLMDAETYKPLEFGILENEQLLLQMEELFIAEDIETVVIEKIASYGMAVGATVFDTCIWIGRFSQVANYHFGCKVEYIYRSEEKMNLCHSMKAKDANIRQALIDRFGEVGTKRSPGWFYGVSKDIWAAIAVGVTYLDKVSGKC